MQSFLGVPILLRGVAYGNLYLTEKEGGGSFTDEDEELTQLLAAQAAVAIENTRLYETSNRWLRHLESLGEIGDALGQRARARAAPRLGRTKAARLSSTPGSLLIALPEAGREQLRIAAADGEGSDAYGLVGIELELGGSKTGRVLQRGRSERVDSVLDDPEMDQQVARRMGVRSALYVPLLAEGSPIGVVVTHDKLGATSSRFTDEDVRLTESLAARAATAVALSQRVSRDAVRRVVEAQELERARLARELHDETGQALTSILLGLKSLEDGSGSAESGAAMAELRQLVVSTLQDVRRLAVELGPLRSTTSASCPRSSDSATSSRSRASISVEVQSELSDARLPAEVETALYRIAQEAFTNVLKHAGAARVTLRLSRRDDTVTLVVHDDGKGFDSASVRDGQPRLGGHAGARRPARGSSDDRFDRRCGDDAQGRGSRTMIRVLIVDDHAVVRSGLRRLLDAEADIETVGEAPNADRAVFEAIEVEAGRCAHGPRHAREGRNRRDAGSAASSPGGARAGALDAGRPAVRPCGVRGGSERLRAQGGG